MTGVQLDDPLALAWFFWNAARNAGQVGFGAGLIAATGLESNVIDTFHRQCTLSMQELRERLADEHMRDAETPWARYTLQEFPFLQLSDGSVPMLRLQYAVQRMFGDLLHLKVHDALKVSGLKVRAKSHAKWREMANRHENETNRHGGETKASVARRRTAPVLVE